MSTPIGESDSSASQPFEKPPLFIRLCGAGLTVLALSTMAETVNEVVTYDPSNRPKITLADPRSIVVVPIADTIAQMRTGN